MTHRDILVSDRVAGSKQRRQELQGQPLQPAVVQLASIQILRGVAALMVVAYHITEALHTLKLYGIPVFVGGIAGVDIFFVISGFVMYLATERSDVTPSRFWRARLIRVVPLYYLSTLLFLGVVVLVGRLPADFSFVEVLLSFLFIPFNNSLNGQPVPVLGVGWTLNYEALFYLIFGFALFMQSRKLQITLVFSIFLTLIVCRFLFEPTTAFGFRVTSPIYLEFVAGIFGAIWILRYPANRDRALLGVIVIAAGAGAIFYTSVVMPYSPRTLIYGIPALAVVVGFVMCESVCRIPSLAVWRYFGDASYSIYLVHGIVIYAIIATGPYPGASTPLVAVLLTFVTVGGGLVAYGLIEKPISAATRSITRAR